MIEIFYRPSPSLKKRLMGAALPFAQEQKVPSEASPARQSFAPACTLETEFETIALADGTLSIKKYTGKGDTVAIPPAIQGKRVTSIGNGAFKNCTNLTSVTIPGNVPNIGREAFEGCLKLTTISVLPGTKRIPKNAFEAFPNVKTILLPDSITFIDEEAFSGCKNLTLRSPVRLFGRNYVKTYARKHGLNFEKL